MKKLFYIIIALIFALSFSALSVAQDTNTRPKEVPVKKPVSKVDIPTEEKIKPDDQKKYDVPLIKVAELKAEKTKFTVELEGLSGNAYLKPDKEGKTKIEISFGNLKDVPKDKLFHLWMVSSEGKYTKIGKIVNTGKDAQADVSGGTLLKDFGLFITVEETEVETPKGKSYAAFKQAESAK